MHTVILSPKGDSTVFAGFYNLLKGITLSGGDLRPKKGDYVIWAKDAVPQILAQVKNKEEIENHLKTRYPSGIDLVQWRFLISDLESIELAEAA